VRETVPTSLIPFKDAQVPGARVYASFPRQRVHFIHHFTLPLPECPFLEHVDEARLDGDFRLDAHTHSLYEFVYVNRGRYDRWIGDQRYRLGPGDIHIIRPGEVHHARGEPSGGELEIFGIAINPQRLPLIGEAAPARGAADAADVARSAEDVAVLDGDAALLEQRVIHGAHGIEALYRRILSECDRAHFAGRDAAGRRERARAVISVQALQVELLVFVARCRADQAPASRTPDRADLQRLLRWLRSRLADPPSVAEMAARVGLSPAHFALVFKRETGRTPLEHLTALRIDEAASRLAAADAPPVGEVAAALGYSGHYFSLLFKRLKGCSPRSWRRRYHR
jgi:AraC-like DNA-binding protein